MSMKCSLIVFLSLTVAGCVLDTFDDRIVVKNQSNERVYYLKCSYDKLSTMFKKSAEQVNGVTYINFVKEIRPVESRRERRMGSRTAWESYINEVCEDGKLRIFTFSIDTLKKYNWKEICENERYLTKKEFSVEDLNKLNWEVKLP